MELLKYCTKQSVNQQWSYCSLALNNQYIYIIIGSGNGLLPRNGKYQAITRNNPDIKCPSPGNTSEFNFNKLPKGFLSLTYRAWVMHICTSKLGPHWLSAPSHYQNQCRHCQLDICQLSLNKNTTIFIQENKFENVCKMATILSQPQCVKIR